MKRPEEIERKFLVADLPDLTTVWVEPIHQGYLTTPGDSVEIRIRQKGVYNYITMKSGSGLARVEHEAQIAALAFSRLWSATAVRRIEKTRWIAHLTNHRTFELDVFEGTLSGLKLVEVEFSEPSAAQAFSPPSWFRREVRENERFSNAFLALHGMFNTPSISPAA